MHLGFSAFKLNFFLSFIFFCNYNDHSHAYTIHFYLSLFVHKNFVNFMYCILLSQIKEKKNIYFGSKIKKCHKNCYLDFLGASCPQV